MCASPPEPPVHASCLFPGGAPGRRLVPMGAPATKGAGPSARFEVVPKCLSDDVGHRHTFLFGAARESFLEFGAAHSSKRRSSGHVRWITT